MASESERKYEEISRRLGVVQEVTILVLMLISAITLICWFWLTGKHSQILEQELKKAEERADSNQKKVDSIDEELKVTNHGHDDEEDEKEGW